MQFCWEFYLPKKWWNWVNLYMCLSVQNMFKATSVEAIYKISEEKVLQESLVSKIWWKLFQESFRNEHNDAWK